MREHNRYMLLTEELAPAQAKTVTPARNGFVPINMDREVFLQDVLPGEVTEDLESGAIRPEILAIEEGATKNHNVYVSGKLRLGAVDHEGHPSGVASWHTPYPIPILTNHDTEGEPLGRIMTESDAKFARVNGRGHVFIYPIITHPETVRKVMAGEYLTGSVGMRTDSAVCTVCDHDILKTMEMCDHRKGRRYDKEGNTVSKGGTLTQWTLGNLWAREYSFVNMPAKASSGVKQVNTLTESILEKWEQLGKIVMNESELGFCIVEFQEPSVSVTVPDLQVNEEHPQGSQPNKEGPMLFTVKDLEEAKLSSAARKRLPDSAFCGPNRSFPAHDAAHVRNGLARLSQFRSRMPASTAKRILACLRRRAKQKGVKVSKRESDGSLAWIDAEEYFKSLYEETGILKMSEAEVDALLKQEWIEDDRNGVIAAEEDEIEEFTKFLDKLDESSFFGPSRSFPVLNQEGARVAKAVLLWESVRNEISETNRAKVLGMIESAESGLPESGFNEKIQIPAWFLECDYVTAANLIEHTVPRAIDGFREADGAPDKSTPEPEQTDEKGSVVKEEVTRLREENKIRENLCGQLREENQTLKAENTRLDGEVTALQETAAKSSSEFREALIDQIVDLKKAQGSPESDTKLRERYTQMEPKTLIHVQRELTEGSMTGGRPASDAAPAYESQVDSTTPPAGGDAEGVLAKAQKALERVTSRT